MTQDKGRGLFANRLIKKGEIIIAEKAMAIGQNNVEGSKELLLSFDE